jgi:hypothetical protein
MRVTAGRNSNGRDDGDLSDALADFVFFHFEGSGKEIVSSFRFRVSSFGLAFFRFVDSFSF